jgi:predicted dehydrogenase
LCDVYEPHLELAQQRSPADAKAYTDARDLLAQRGIDFVVIATPDHHHWPQLRAALDAGVDVYLEKPLSVSLEQSQAMVEAVRKSGRIVQIGMQRRSMPFIMQAKKAIDSGALGKISLAKAMWNWHFRVPLDNSPLPGKLDWDRFLGPARKRPLEPRRFRWWRGFWDYSGGNMTDQGTHLMDVVQWLTDSPSPLSAVCQGYVNDAKEGEVPDVFSAGFEYPDFIATWTLNYSSIHQFDWSIHLQGKDAAMVLDRRGYRLYKDVPASSQPWALGGKSDLLAEERDVDSALSHPRNFLDCIRSRSQPNCTVEIAAAAVAGPHMANIAWRENRKVAARPAPGANT